MATLPAPKIEIQKAIDKGETQKITSETPLEDYHHIIETRNKLLWDKVNSPTNNPLMILQDEKALMPVYEVYAHIDVLSNEIQYYGHGLVGRGGDCVSRRDYEHSLWMLSQALEHRDFYKVLHRHLTKIEAKAIEKRLLKASKTLPFFNKKDN